MASARPEAEHLQAEIAAVRDHLQCALSGVAHDLSQSLTTLHGCLELALRSDGTPAPVREMLQTALGEAQSLMALVRLVGALGDAEVCGEDAPETSLSAVLSEVREEMDDLAASRGVRLAWEGEAVAAVRAHPSDLRRAISFVIEHALDRSSPGGLVEISTARDARKASAVIRDQGPCISVEDLPHWCEPFYAGHRDPATRRRRLRLAIAKRICESCSGTLTLKNSPPRGVHIILEFPLA